MDRNIRGSIFNRFYRSFGKRILDILFSVIALPFLVIIIIIISPVIYFQDKGPVFYNAVRRGRNGKVYKLYKFRSMSVNNEIDISINQSIYYTEKDPRITRIGKIIRKLSIDEIPQILNVIKGDMSIIGPRPTLVRGDYHDFEKIRKKRLTVRPGITAYSQAYYRNSITKEEKYEKDCYFVDNINLWFDIKNLHEQLLESLRERKYIIILKENQRIMELIHETTSGCWNLESAIACSSYSQGDGIICGYY